MVWKAGVRRNQQHHDVSAVREAVGRTEDRRNEWSKWSCDINTIRQGKMGAYPFQALESFQKRSVVREDVLGFRLFVKAGRG